MAEEKMPRCIVCAKAKPLTDMICDECKAQIRGEAVDRHHQIRKEAEKEFRKEGVTPKK